MKIKNDLLLKSIKKQNIDRTPIWLMRQAGRYLPEYQAVRKQAGDFLSLCKNPQLACEVTLQPLDRFDLDAAIIFSDILTIPDAMGCGLEFIEHEGPIFQFPIKNLQDIHKLHNVEPEEDLSYVMQAIELTQKELQGKVPLIGFSGSPWTIATYMVEGGTSKNFSCIKKLLYQDPQILHLLLEKLTITAIDYLNAQIRAGVNVVMIFDTWGGILSPHNYQNFSLQYMQKILSSLTLSSTGEKIPTILFTKNGGLWLDKISESGCDVIGLDWTIDIGKARQEVGAKVALQGNLDPTVLYGKPEQITAEVKRILSAYGEGSGHIFNLGHGILPDVPIENVTVLVNSVHELSRSYHKLGESYDQEKQV